MGGGTSSYLTVLSVKGLQSFDIVRADVLRIALPQVQVYEIRKGPCCICFGGGAKK